MNAVITPTLADTSSVAGASEVLELATFYVGDLLVGADIRQVEEINRQMDFTPLPHVPPFVLGVLNLRGNVVTVVDLRTILGVKPNSQSRRSHNVIIRFEGERIGLAVDRIADVVRTTMDAIDELPANFDSMDTRFLQGVYTMENELLLVLNVQEALSLQ
jgi:purine-binding chemotaxis protein CheW